MERLLLKIILLAAFIIPLEGQAQNTTDSLEGYIPPPMFGAPRPVPSKKIQPKAPKMPNLSQPVKDISSSHKVDTQKKETKLKKESQKTIIPLKKPEHPKTKFKGKPVGKILEKEKIEKNKIKPGLEPIDLLKKEPKEKKVNSKGVVKGPKTMPSNKKQDVESEILFEPEEIKPVGLIDRAQKKETAQKTASTHLPPPNFKLPSLKVMADGGRKLNMTFPESQHDLKEEQIYTLDKLILPITKENKKTRLQIVSYASPQENSLSGDRRVALSRAMAIRNHIIEQGISANRLDVRSLGAQTDIQPIDRVEIFLIN